jgi:hypothetical protein
LLSFVSIVFSFVKNLLTFFSTVFSFVIGSCVNAVFTFVTIRKSRIPCTVIFLPI